MNIRNKSTCNYLIQFLIRFSRIVWWGIGRQASTSYHNNGVQLQTNNVIYFALFLQETANVQQVCSFLLNCRRRKNNLMRRIKISFTLVICKDRWYKTKATVAKIKWFLFHRFSRRYLALGFIYSPIWWNIMMTVVKWPKLQIFCKSNKMHTGAWRRWPCGEAVAPPKCAVLCVTAVDTFPTTAPLQTTEPYVWSSIFSAAVPCRQAVALFKDARSMTMWGKVWWGDKIACFA